MRHLGHFSQLYQTVAMETMTAEKNLDFSFCYAFASSMTVQNFITKKKKKRKGEKERRKMRNNYQPSNFQILIF